MPHTLLKPLLLRTKNTFLTTRGNRAKHLVAGSLWTFFSVTIFISLYSLFGRSDLDDALRALIATKLLSISAFGFFVLLLFSNVIVALGFLFTANDLPLLVSAPVSFRRLYLARLIQTAFSSSWMFFLFAPPVFLAYALALDCGVHFLLIATFSSIPFLVIPAALGTIIISIFVNIIPAYRVRDILAFVCLLVVIATLALSRHYPPATNSLPTDFTGFTTSLVALHSPDVVWLPSYWVSESLNTFVTHGEFAAPAHSYLALLWGTAFVFVTLGAFLYQRLFLRGWSLSREGTRNLRAPASVLSSVVGRFLIPFHQQLRAMVFKDARMFLRDPTQAVHLLLLLTLSFVYLYNFRAIKEVPTVENELLTWWHALLSVANVVLGGCVIAAVSTRFVFPAISLEGRAYWLVRVAPLSIRQLLWKKFLTWIVPVSIVAVTLLLSGAFALDVSENGLLVSVFFAISLSIGIVGLAIGVGAVYANFRWETPIQVTAGFGSLVFMLLALGLIMLTSIPASFLILLTTWVDMSQTPATLQTKLAIAASASMSLVVSLAAARWGLHAGEQSLAQLEE